MLCSPSTHLIASEILLLPEPFGPITDVMPLLNSNIVLSAKDLNPCNSNLFKYILFSFVVLGTGLPPTFCQRRDRPNISDLLNNTAVGGRPVPKTTSYLSVKLYSKFGFFSTYFLRFSQIKTSNSHFLSYCLLKFHIKEF